MLDSLLQEVYLVAVVGRLRVHDLDMRQCHGCPHIIDDSAGVHP